ncbi:hypothetical protein DL769_001789 [Monosporascus sp. CRB-8-3]|nr:hypothetical protein DL769_001789 [Monosporascus sp. CRB-8-3]
MSEDVSRFLEQVKELGDRRIEEDEKRSRELEEKILQEKKERQARRRERARSISPQKSSPANTPPPSARHSTIRGSDRLDLDSSPVLGPPATPPFQTSPRLEPMTTRGELSTSPSKENEPPSDAEEKTPTRTDSAARGLSWQRRPNSQASERSRSRPLSVMAAENAARSSNTPSEPASESETISRDQIASALSDKDPSWFRQTADRGLNSAAYRRSQVEDEQRADFSPAKTQLPGMSRTTSTDSPKEDAEPPSGSPTSPDKLASPLSLSSAQKLDPPTAASQPDAENEKVRQSTFGSPLDRTSPTRTERPVSPTKGMGGFVQSAMMKRSDSVSKRWSVQSPSGLQRGNPMSNRASVDLSQLGVVTRSRPGSSSRDLSTGPSSRPTSSQGKENAPAEEQPSGDIKKSSDPDTKASSDSLEQGQDNVTPPVSPSKTMDPRRWSPTKSSWLESALNKPETPRPKTGHTAPNQPAWMAEIQKMKAQKAADPNITAERTRSSTVSHKHQVSIGGLMRSSAPGVATKPAVPLGGFQSPVTSPTVVNPRPPFGSVRSDSATSSTVADENAQAEPTNDSDTTAPSAMLKPKPEAKPKLETKPETKLETQAKKDFRANLKPAHAPSSSTSSQEPEFKNIFGKLRKTTTQHYEAPDELKDNIMKGKAALNLTGGPQKTERKDEFKEAILARKKEFQQVQSEGRGVARNNSIASENPAPEGLVKRFQLQRTGTFKEDSAAVDSVTTDPKRSSAALKRDSVQDIPTKPEWSGPSGRKGSIQDASGAKPASVPSPTSTSQDETRAPGRLPGKLAGSALANRFNPALAGLLARGPPGSSGPIGSAPMANSQAGSSAGGDGNEAGSGPKLTHMTKNRARGPKRKAPTSVSAPTTAAKEPESRQSSEVTTEFKAAAIKQQETSRARRPTMRSLNTSVENARDLPSPRTSPAKESGPSTRIHEQVAAFAALKRHPSPTKGTGEPEQADAQPPSPRKLDTKRMSIFLDNSSQATPKDTGSESPKSATRGSGFPPAVKPKPSLDKLPSPGTPSSQPGSPPVDKFPRSKPDPTSLSPKTEPSTDRNEPNPLQQPGPAVGAALGILTSGSRPLPTPPAVTSTDPTRSPTRPLPAEPQQSSRPLPTPTPTPKSPPPTSVRSRSPTKQAEDVSTLLEDFFGPERPKRDYHVDAAELLMNRPNPRAPKVQTLSAQLFQFSADGKKVPVSSHRERTLFEREMYLCVHVFNNEAGKKTTEVYFWAGDEVPLSEVGDASIFLARESRAAGGRVIKLQQNKETPEFIQALGGIVITQRGSGNKYDSLAPHMLCGRRHLGHVVFDEVDFTPSSLCSGFPYVISQAGRCYLWKGKGSGVDELSCARLIGMDFALSGEMEEIEDGHEPEGFWGLFDGGSKPGSADHWRLKPSYDKYCSRLFCSDAASKQQIVELSPFSQNDLKPTGIYILDAFFEMYIIVGSRAQSQYTSFHNALDFAQEYAILAAGMEDRPFVPVSTVVLEGIPRDMKSVFRKWRDARSPTIMNAHATGAGIKRGRSLRVMPLNQALSALDSSGSGKRV